MQTRINLKLWLSRVAALIICVAACAALSAAFGQKVEITPDTAVSRNLFVQWNADDPERIDVIKWNSAGLNGTETNLTRSAALGTNAPCYNGDVEYFGNSWAPPDPPNGKVLVGAGTVGTRSPGPDSKVLINSVSSGCAPISANVSVNTIYKFWQGGQAINKWRVTRTFTFDSAFDRRFRPYIPRLYPISRFNMVYFPNADGTTLMSRQAGGGFCPVGCVETNWNSNDEETSWFAIHNSVTGQGLIVRHHLSSSTAALWIDWDGASNTNATSVLLLPPTGGFTGEVKEMETLCFYDADTWLPSLTLPPGC